jgi:hypothetical protein
VTEIGDEELAIDALKWAGLLFEEARVAVFAMWEIELDGTKPILRLATAFFPTFGKTLAARSFRAPQRGRRPPVFVGRALRNPFSRRVQGRGYEPAHGSRLLFASNPWQSVLIHQDFVHDWLPWIHVTMGALAPYFEFISTVLWSAVWLNTKPIPAAALSKPL